MALPLALALALALASDLYDLSDLCVGVDQKAKLLVRAQYLNE